MKRLLASMAVAAAALGLTAGAAHAVSNVALGKPVTADFSSGGSILAGSAALASLTDGVFLPEGNAWNVGTVHWSGTTPIITVNLGALYSISSIVLQHDNNDTYAAVYPVGAGVGFAFIGPQYNGGGVATSTYLFGAPITASQVSFMSISGDGAFALSEIQINGVAVPVPEPGQSALLLVGLALMGGVVARRRSAARV